MLVRYQYHPSSLRAELFRSRACGPRRAAPAPEAHGRAATVRCAGGPTPRTQGRGPESRTASPRSPCGWPYSGENPLFSSTTTITIHEQIIDTRQINTRQNTTRNTRPHAPPHAHIIRYNTQELHLEPLDGYKHTKKTQPQTEAFAGK